MPELVRSHAVCRARKGRRLVAAASGHARTAPGLSNGEGHADLERRNADAREWRGEGGRAHVHGRSSHLYWPRARGYNHRHRQDRREGTAVHRDGEEINHVRRATCGVQRATCNVRRATCWGALCVVAAITLRAQQASPPAAKPLVPVAASTLAESPADYYGQYVSVVGTVEQTLTTLAFTIDQDRTKQTGKEVLILATTLTSPVDPNSYVTVLGEVVQFTEEIAGRATVDLPPDVAAKYRGRPAVLATS